MNEPGFEVVWPLGHQVMSDDPVAGEARAPVTDLKHATVGFLWNYTRKGDVMFSIMKEVLNARFPGIRFVDHAHFGDIHGAQEAEVIAGLPQRLRDSRVDIAVVGIGG